MDLDLQQGTRKMLRVLNKQEHQEMGEVDADTVERTRCKVGTVCRASNRHPNIIPLVEEVLELSEIPRDASNGIELVDAVRGAQAHTADSQSEMHMATKFLDEGHSLAKHEVGNALRRQVDGPPLDQRIVGRRSGIPP